MQYIISTELMPYFDYYFNIGSNWSAQHYQSEFEGVPENMDEQHQTHFKRAL